MAGGVLVLLLAIYGLDVAVTALSGGAVNRMEVWIYICSAHMVFAIYASISLFLSRDVEKYLQQTVLAFGAAFVVGFVIGAIVGDEKVMETTIYRQALIAVIIAFLAFISMAVLASRIVKWTRDRDDQFLHSNKWEDDEKK